MDTTRHNLIRVNDVLGEIGKQISSLRYQVQKLKRFKGLKERVRTLELALASQEYTGLHRNQSLKKAQLEELKDRQTLLMTEINKINAEIVAKKTQLQENEEEFATIEKKKLEIEYSIKEEENNLERKKERVGDLEKQIKKATQDMEENLSRLHLEEEEVNKSGTLRNQLQDRIKNITTHLKGEEEKLSTLRKDFVSIRNALERKKEELFAVGYEISRRKDSIGHEEQTRDEYEHRLEQNQEEIKRAEMQLDDEAKQKAQILKELGKCRQEKELLEKEQETNLETIRHLSKEIKSITDALSAAKERQARFESQRESLQEFQDNFEGCSEGVRWIMQKKDGLERVKNGVYGLVADFIEAEPHLEVALESVLGEKLQYVVVKSHAEGVEAVEYLKRESLGRGSFIPIETEKSFDFEDQSGEVLRYEANPLINMVKVKDEYQPIIRYLLGGVLLVENFSKALSVWKNSNIHYPLVTLDGEIIDPKGIITGGAQNGVGNGFLRKKRNLKELEHKLSSLGEELFSLQKKGEEKERELEDKQKSLQDTQERLIQKKLFLQNKERDYQQHNETSQRIQKKREFLLLEKKKLMGELTELQEDLEIKRSEQEEFHSKQILLEETFSELQKKEREFQEKIDLGEKSFNNYKADFVDLKTQLSSLTSTLDLRQKTLINLKKEILKGKQAKEEAEKEAAELRKGIETALGKVHTMTKSYQHYQNELGEQEEKLEEGRRSLYEHEGKLKTIQQEFNNLQPSIQKLDHELTQIISDTRYLEDKIKGKYHVSLGEAVNQFPREKYPEEETRAKLEKLEQAQEKMIEEVNFNAQREYEERVEKLKFYQTQAEDLNKSLDSLQEAIHKINRTSKERFRTTFNQVNENFKKILPLVFEGGEGKLILTDESDLLETGVEIRVQPAGKNLKHISLLSGGEKALSAISLLFALYLSKPSPFCLLDEVDSPLDDASVDRFITILKRFASDSQFILITHNKKTMEIADTLYGITMEEPGISKIVSVRLN